MKLVFAVTVVSFLLCGVTTNPHRGGEGRGRHGKGRGREEPCNACGSNEGNQQTGGVDYDYSENGAGGNSGNRQRGRGGRGGRGRSKGRGRGCNKHVDMANSDGNAEYEAGGEDGSVTVDIPEQGGGNSDFRSRGSFGPSSPKGPPGGKPPRFGPQGIRGGPSMGKIQGNFQPSGNFQGQMQQGFLAGMGPKNGNIQMPNQGGNFNGGFQGRQIQSPQFQGKLPSFPSGNLNGGFPPPPGSFQIKAPPPPNFPSAPNFQSPNFQPSLPNNLPSAPKFQGSVPNFQGNFPSPPNFSGKLPPPPNFSGKLPPPPNFQGNLPGPPSFQGKFPPPPELRGNPPGLPSFQGKLPPAPNYQGNYQNGLPATPNFQGSPPSLPNGKFPGRPPNFDPNMPLPSSNLNANGKVQAQGDNLDVKVSASLPKSS